jgi:hypothetical protein
MRKILKSAFYTIVIVFFAITGCRPDKTIDVSDNFDKPGLSSIWSTDRMEKQSFEIQSDIVHNGTGAAKITLKAGDTYEPGEGKDLPTERDELMESTALVSVEGTQYEYRFSMFLPDTFPVLPVRLVIAQWKEFCIGDSCHNDSPVAALRYSSGELAISLQTGEHRKNLYECSDEIRNRWIDFRFIIRFSEEQNGVLIAFIDGKEVVNYKGITSYPRSRGYTLKKNRYYFKMGLYRDLIPEPMCIYIDDYSKKEIKAK